MANKPSKNNKVCLAIRSKLDLSEGEALEAVLAILRSGHSSGPLLDRGLSVQSVPTARGVCFYLREIKKDGSEPLSCISEK